VDEESRKTIRRLLHKLPAKYREPLLLSDRRDHTFEEIAALLGVPTGTAKWRAMEGRRLLRDKVRRKAHAGRGGLR